jgi:hypothetical protein
VNEREAVSDLKARAERAAAAIVAEYDVHLPNVPYELVVSLIAVGWLEGSQDGIESAVASAREIMGRPGSGLRSVKS